jgi:iron complex outermembrane receptor protein
MLRFGWGRTVSAGGLAFVSYVALNTALAAQESSRDKSTAAPEARAQATTTLPTIHVRSKKRRPARTTTVADTQPPAAPAAEAVPGDPIVGYVAKQSATASKTSAPLIETPQAVSVVGA